MAMKIGDGFLSAKERSLFEAILFEHEGAVAFDDSEMGLLSDDIEPPVKIHTVPHGLGSSRTCDFRNPCRTRLIGSFERILQRVTMNILKDLIEDGISW